MKQLVHSGLMFFVLTLFTNCDSEPLPPNILFVMMDDLGYGQFGLNNDELTVEQFDPFFLELVRDEQGYDPEQALDFSRRAMPTLNQIANEGVFFTSAYTTSSLCSPSRIGIATGILQNRMGIYRNTDGEEKGLEPHSHLAERMKELGYATAHIGKWHMGKRKDQMILDALSAHGIDDTLTYSEVWQNFPEVFKVLHDNGYYGSVIDRHNPLQNGFDYYFGYNNWASQFYNSTLVWENYQHAGRQKGYNTDVFTDKALDFIRDQVSAERPFYVQLHYHAVHDSLQPKAPEAYFKRFDSDSYDLNNFYAHVYGVDFNIGRIMNYLKEEGIDRNTLIIFTSDNGAMAGGPSVLPGNAPFAGHKGTLFQGGIRVPFLIYWPEGIKNPGVSDQLVSTLDILPTCIDAAGGEIPVGLDGESLLPLITGKSAEPVHDHLIWAGLHSRDWGFLLHKSFKVHGEERELAPPAWVVIKDGHLLRYRGEIVPELNTECPEGAPPELQLFDIKNDEAEVKDIFSEDPGRVKKMVRIFENEASGFRAPVDWERSKWEELMNMPGFKDPFDPGMKLPLVQQHFSNMVAAALKAGKLPRSAHDDSIVWARNGFDWTEGFFPGSLWYLYELTGEERWKEDAKHIQQWNKEDRFYSNHDLGFIFNCSYGNGKRLTGNKDYLPVMIDAGNTLIDRFDPDVGCIKSWNTDRGWQAERDWQFPVIIDNMMNLELLFELTIITVDEKYADVAIQHANTTIENHFREDYSSYHVVDYDSISGEIRSRERAQGYAHESSWSRGQAWGLYGYTMCYRYTGDQQYLDQAISIADYILDNAAMREDDVPYWDYDAPGIPDEPRDASAAAITASALIELSQYTDGAYLARAKRILSTLSGEEYFARPGTNANFILKHSTGSIPHGNEIDAPLVYADYYYLEALVRLSRL